MDVKQEVLKVICRVLKKSKNQITENVRLQDIGANITNIRNIIEILQDKLEISYVPDEDDDIEKLQIIEDLINHIIYYSSDTYISSCIDEMWDFEPVISDPNPGEDEDYIIGVIAKHTNILRIDLELYPDARLIDDLGCSILDLKIIFLEFGLHFDPFKLEITTSDLFDLMIEYYAF